MVKPARGEQGRGITVGVRDADGLERARGPRRCSSAPTSWSRSSSRATTCGSSSSTGEVVAAAVRRPAEIVGDGRRTVAELIASTSRRRERATGGESRIPMDDVTEEVVAESGYAMDDVPPERGAHPRTADGEPAHRRHDRGRHRPAAPGDRRGLGAGRRRRWASRSPGWTSWCPDVDGPDYVFIEANERPGLANHEPQPVVERFVDLLFPETRRR